MSCLVPTAQDTRVTRKGSKGAWVGGTRWSQEASMPASLRASIPEDWHPKGSGHHSWLCSEVSFQ